MRAQPSRYVHASFLSALVMVWTAAPWATAAAQGQAASPVQKVAEVEGISEYRLGNGLRVVLFPDPSAPRLTVNVTYFVGSRHEGYGETGMAHLLEHLLFKGTPTHPNIPEEITEHGAEANGSTWYDRTNYYETFIATDDNFAWALELEADRMVNSRVAQEDLESEMTVVRNEFESRENSPLNVLEERTLSTAYLWHGYGRSPIGARSDIENVPIERLQAFYRRYYQPDNALLVVAGKLEETHALEMVQETFGAIPSPDRSAPELRTYPTYTDEPDQDGERIVHLRRVGDTQLLMVNHHVPPGSHADFAAVEVLDFVLSDSPSGRLYRALVESGKAARLGSYSYQFREASPLVHYVEVRADGDLEAAREAMTATYDALADEPVTDADVQRAKTALLKDIELAFNNSQRIALRLSEWAGMGDWRLFFLHRDRIEAVTTEDVNRAAARYLVPSNRTFGYFHPTPAPVRAAIPDPPDVEALLRDYRGREVVAQAEAFDPTPLNIELRVNRYSLGATGFQVALLPKETRGDQAVARFRILFGDEESLSGQTFAGSLAADMLMRGTQRHTRQQLQDELDRLKAQVSLSGSDSQMSGSVTTTRDNLPAVLGLLAEVLRTPAFDPDEFERLKAEQLAAYESQLSEPTTLAGNALDRHLNPYPEGHPRHVRTMPEEIEELRAATLDQVRQFHATFYGAKGGHMAVVGDFDAFLVLNTLEGTFGEWTATVPFQRIETRHFETEAVNQTIETPDKAQAVLLAGLNLPLRDDDPDYPALVMGDLMFGGGFLNSRLALRIRQQEGLSYGVGSSLSAHPIDAAGLFSVFAIYAPENVQRLEEAFLEELRRTADEGFTSDELEVARSGYLQSVQVSRSDDRDLAGQLSQDLYLGRTLAWHAGLETKISRLTVEEVNAAFRKWIDPSRVSIVKAGDFATTRPAADLGAR